VLRETFHRLSTKTARHSRRISQGAGGRPLRRLARSCPRAPLTDQCAGGAGEQWPTLRGWHVTEPAARRADPFGGLAGRVSDEIGLRCATTDQRDDGASYAIEVGTQSDQRLRSDTLALADEPEKDVFGSDGVVAELQRLPQRELENLLGGVNGM
jgi:hypothetical protein